jgi:hypothetical protein
VVGLFKFIQYINKKQDKRRMLLAHTAPAAGIQRDQGSVVVLFSDISPPAQPQVQRSIRAIGKVLFLVEMFFPSACPICEVKYRPKG